MPETLLVQIRGDASSLNNELNRSNTQLGTFGKGINGAAVKSTALGTASGMLAASGVMALANAAVNAASAVKEYTAEAGMMAAQNERLEGASTLLATSIGTSSQAMVDAIVNASGQTVSNMDAIRISNLAMMAGVAESSEEMAALTEMATVMGRAIGMDTTESVKRLTEAIAKNETELLDEFGLVVRAETAYQNYARSLGVSKDALTQEQKSLAFKNETLAQGIERMQVLGGVTIDTLTKTERYTAASSNFKQAWGQAWNEFGLGAAATDLATLVLTNATESLQDTTEDATETTDEYTEAHRRTEEALGGVDAATKNLALTQAEYLKKQIDQGQKLTELEQEYAEERTKILNKANGDKLRAREEADQKIRALGESNRAWEIERIESIYRGDISLIETNTEHKLNILQQGNIEQRKELEAHLKETTIMYNLSVMEQEGTLERATGGMASKAKEAFSLIEANMLPVTDAMKKEIPEAAQVATQAMTREARLQAGTLGQTAKAAEKTADTIKQVETTAEQTSQKALEDALEVERAWRNNSGFLTRLGYDLGIIDAPAAITNNINNIVTQNNSFANGNQAGLTYPMLNSLASQ